MLGPASPRKWVYRTSSPTCPSMHVVAIRFLRGAEVITVRDAIRASAPPRMANKPTKARKQVLGLFYYRRAVRCDVHQDPTGPDGPGSPACDLVGHGKFDHSRYYVVGTRIPHRDQTPA